MKILFFELKKYLLKPSVTVCLILFSVVNFVKVFEMYFYFGGGRFEIMSGDKQFYAAEDILYEKYGGEITDEKITELKQELEDANKKLEEYGVISEPMKDTYSGYPSGDVSIIRSVISGYEYAILYTNSANSVSAAAQENIAFYNEKNDYEVRLNEYISRSFSGRTVNYYVRPDGWTALFDYKFSTILTMLLIGLILAPIFAGEKEGGFDRLIKSAGKSSAVVRSKLIAALITVFGVTLFFFLTDIAYVSAIHGLRCFDAPIYSIAAYADCPLDITLFEGVMLAFSGRLAAMLFFGAVTVLVSSVCRNSGISLAITILLGGAMIFLSETLPDVFDPLSLIYMQDHFSSFNAVNVLGFPVLTVFFTMTLTLALTAVVSTIAANRGLK